MTIDGDTPEEIARMIREARTAGERHDREEAALPGLQPYFIDHDAITQNDVDEFREVLNSAQAEAPLQKHLADHPLLLVQALGGGHGRWVIPGPRLGAEHVPDFLLAERSSLGIEWVLVELEAAHRRLFTQRGDPAEYLNHAIRQITDWRTWLTDNRDYATRPKDQNGLGLVDITATAPGWIIIGRRADTDTRTRRRRRQLGEQSNITIHTYDWLIDAAQGRVDDLAKYRE